MNRSYLSIIVGLVLVVFAHPASAQSTAARPTTPLNNASRDRSDAKAESDRIAKELCTRSLARIADTLWSVDPEQGRTLFRKAWEAAETADQNQGPYTIGEGPLNLRREVLRLAAPRDLILTRSNKLDASGGSVFLNLICSAMLD